LNNVDN